MPEISEATLQAVDNRTTLFHFLQTTLLWPVLDEPEAEPFVYERPELCGTVEVNQIVPFQEGDPFLILLAEFQTDFKRTELRDILRRIRQDDRLTGRYSSRSLEEIIFVCPTQNYGGVSFAHFVQREGTSPRLAVFGWDKGHLHETRTLRQINLPALLLPGRNLLDEIDWATGKPRWLKAWDVQAVTRDFFRDYKQVFDQVQERISGVPSAEAGVPGDPRLFTQRLMNRLLFLQFLAKRGWLRFGGSGDYLPALWQDWKTHGLQRGEDNFYRSRLRQLFFLGLNNSGCRDLRHSDPFLFGQIGEMPFLNGGLFNEEAGDQTTLDDPGVVVPNDAIKAVLNLFANYNFTISESTPDDVEVAVDPEMLGEVFERLVTLDERKSSGSYYTPRVIVQFMCREALKGYLDGKIDPVIDRVPGAAENVTKRNAESLLRKLTRVRVVDPACGSGAYLLGMLHELFDLMGVLETRVRPLSEQDKYRRKLDIIQRNLYGVDLQEFAIETARMRLWLSLVVEDERHPLDDPDDCDVALPNLDFKIEAGDSLAAPSPRSLEFSLYGPAYAEDARALARLEAEFFTPNRDGHGRRKELVKAEIVAKQGAIKHLIGSDTLPEVLDWRVAFAEVFAPLEPIADLGGALNLGGTLAELPLIGGFDIVLANPPYGASVGDDVRDIYFDRKLPAERGQSKDTYGLFIARALQLLRPGGQFSYIVSDTWRTIKSYKPLRRRLAETTAVGHVLDLPSWVFDGPTVNTCILTFTASAPAASHTLIAGDLRNIKPGDWRTLEENLRFAAARGVDLQTTRYARYTYKQSLIGTYDNYSFFIGSPKLYGLMSDPRFQKLGGIADVKQGLATADNEYYLRKREGIRGSYRILDESLLLSETQISALTDEEKLNGVDPSDYAGRHFVPYDKGGESDAVGGWLPNYYVPTGYFIDWSEAAVNRLRVATVADVKRRKGKAEAIKPSDEGARAAVIRNPLCYFKEGVTFSRTGVYAPTFRYGCNAAFDTEGSMMLSQQLTPTILLAITSSTLLRYFVKCIIDHTVHAQVDDIKEYPIAKPDRNVEVAIEGFVSAIVEAQKINPRYPYHLHEQKEIDALVYELYGLDADDIREVELWFCRRYPLLAQAQGVLAEINIRYADHLAHADRVLARPPGYWQSHPWLTLIATGESATLEFKESLEYDTRNGGANPGVLGSALKTISAFANTDGGTLLIGVADNGDIKGLERDYSLLGRGGNRDAFELKLRSLLQGRFQPPFALPTHHQVAVAFDDLPGGTVCKITVQPVPRTETIHFDNSVYVRDGNGSRKMEGPALTGWMQERMRQ